MASDVEPIVIELNSRDEYDAAIKRMEYLYGSPVKSKEHEEYKALEIAVKDYYKTRITRIIL